MNTYGLQPVSGWSNFKTKQIPEAFGLQNCSVHFEEPTDEIHGHKVYQPTVVNLDEPTGHDGSRWRKIER